MMNRRQIRVTKGHESIVPLILADAVGQVETNPVTRVAVVFSPPNATNVVFDSSVASAAFSLQETIKAGGKDYTGILIDFATLSVTAGRYLAEVYIYDGNEPSGEQGALWGYLDVDVVDGPGLS